jgi:hypothetical protein
VTNRWLMRESLWKAVHNPVHTRCFQGSPANCSDRRHKLGFRMGNSKKIEFQMGKIGQMRKSTFVDTPIVVAVNNSSTPRRGK